MIDLLKKTFKRVRPSKTPQHHKVTVFIISGFLGAGKTTFITQLVKELNDPKHTMIIENDFGQVSFDASYLKDTGIEVASLVAGCICCNLLSDFRRELKRLVKLPHLRYLIIEPSGVGKLSDILETCKDPKISPHIEMGSITTIVNTLTVPKYADNFGSFFNDQIEQAQQIFMSHIEDTAPLKNALTVIRKINDVAPIYILQWPDISLLNYLYQDPTDRIITYFDNLNVSFDYEITPTTAIQGPVETHCHCHGSLHAHHADNHDCHLSSPFQTFTLHCAKRRSVSEWKNLFTLCINRDTKQRILRIKGSIKTPEGPMFVQYNGSQLSLEPHATTEVPLTIISSQLNDDDFKHLFRELVD